MRVLLCITFTAGLCVVLLTACNVGPKYVKPAAASAPTYKEAAPASYSDAPPGTWQPAQPQDARLKGKWWELFNEPELNTLEEQLNIDNQNIKQYFENFMAARAQVREARAGLFLTLTANPALGVSGTGKGATSTTGALPLEASWAPDLWGRVRNTVHEYQYAAQISAADLENERLTEQAALAVYYFELRGQDGLQDVYNRIVDAYREQLKLTRALVDTGIDSPEVIPQVQESVEAAESAAIGVAANRAIYEHAIATLIGKPASSFSIPVKGLTTPVPAIPVGVPSQLLERRPDIAAAERTMAEANAVIGIGKAAYYPTVTLSGSGGLQSSSIGKLFTLPSLFWSLGASAAQTLFDAGLRNATVAQYTANYNADVALYRQTVLAAFQQVEDYIASLRVSSRQIERQNAAVVSGQSYVSIETARYQTGLDPYLTLITAQLTLLNDQLTQVTLHVNEMTAAVQLIQALGGGWDTTQLPTPTQVSSKDSGLQAVKTP
ncbi:MAG TPA: efflux transporter outer membrane subunit [Bryobacteraceae bacterium]|jgi:NodT family efflux transporter outer membrane factor (OMF) lipoprotein|nr:efflux transporter outer membrane subunit [Bryobacteraceae bacterium]